MIRVWPKDSSLDDFVKEKLENDEFWAPAEAFFLKLMKPKSILDRLKVWDFKEKWDIGNKRSTIGTTRSLRPKVK